VRTFAAIVVAGVATAARARAEPSCAERLDAAATASGEELYAIGLCRERAGDHVGAVSTLRRYLEEGGAERRTEVEQTLATIEPRLARVEVISDVAGVEVRIDGACPIDATSYAPACASNEPSRVVLVNPGERRLTAQHPNFRNVAHVFTIAAGRELRVRLNTFQEQQNPYRDTMWSAWCITGVLVPGTAALGIRTAFAGEGIASPLGIATVGVGIGALVAAGIATYFTIRASRWQPR
jgi:hypothetical protein